MQTRHELPISVRYHETDAQGHVHHAIYFQYFELGRIELLRVAGHDYANLERQGINLVVTEASCRYYRPCRFGDTLRLVIDTAFVRGARIHHTYHLYRGKELIAEGETTVGCVDANGKVRRLPKIFTSIHDTEDSEKEDRVPCRANES